MTNYKNYIQDLELGNIRSHYPAQVDVKTLYENTNQAAAPDSLQGETNTTYQVPPGKKYVMLGLSIYISALASSSEIVFYKGDTEDAITTAVLTIKMPQVLGWYEHTQTDDNTLQAIFPSGKYIVSDPSGNNIMWITMYGYETNA